MAAAPSPAAAHHPPLACLAVVLWGVRPQLGLPQPMHLALPAERGPGHVQRQRVHLQQCTSGGWVGARPLQQPSNLQSPFGEARTLQRMLQRLGPRKATLAHLLDAVQLCYEAAVAVHHH